MNDIDQITSRWGECAKAIQTDINHRDFSSFRRHYREGNALFKDVAKFLNGGSSDDLSHNADKLRDCANLWKGVTEQARPWIDEMRAKLTKVQTDHRKERKLRNRYAKQAKASHNLKVKAG